MTLLALTPSLCLATPALADEAMWVGHTNVMQGPGGTYVDGFWSNADFGLGNFKKVREYASGVYADVPAGAWYEENLRTVYEMGLTEDASAFTPGGGLTLAEVVSLAVRVHRIYSGWNASRQSISLLALKSYHVTLDASMLSLTPGTARTLTAVVSPANTVDTEVVWTSSEPRTATVDQYGTVTAIQPGTAVISAVIPAGAVATCAVQVLEAPGYGVYPNGTYQPGEASFPALSG